MLSPGKLKEMGSVEERLQALRMEWEKGQRRLEILDHQRQDLRDTLLRIGGAIQVLEELLEEESAKELKSAAGGNGVEVRGTPA